MQENNLQEQQDCCQPGEGCCQKNCCTGRYQPKHLVVLLVVLGAIALGVLSILRDRIVNPNQFQVAFTGEAKVFAKPDIAQIQVAVRTDKVKDAVTAVKNNTEKMNQVIGKLKELEIAEKDIKTTSYNLNPFYEYGSTGQRTLAGYEVYQEVTVKIRDLNKVGQVIEGTTAVGANQVGSIAFTIDDLSEIKKQARNEAVAKAQAQAQEVAKLTGIKLGKLVNVYESGGQPPVYQDYAYSRSMNLGLGGGGAAPEIQTGENEVRLEVTLMYEVK